MNHKTGAILVLSGPSGAGKSSLLNKVIGDLGECYFSISTTTRSMRDGEIDGVHYHFVDEDEFKNDMEEEFFLEYAVVHGNYYGTSIKPVKEALKAGKLVIFDIDVQGNATIVNRLGDITTSVFISPPTLSELKRRLEFRSTDTQEVIERRIDMAKREIQRISEYDFLIVNDNIEEAAETLKVIANAAKVKIPGNEINDFVINWEDM
ncbi:MAG: guanylate kinase [Sulfurimonas sp.]|uniref:guanylate kinase n=1 Tax=unclassified Sulfurimonas TaxID=2623549 RepID=UPI0008B7E4F4|nr:MULTISPECIES: guanylate kinase [unclassified Sulfurimonas]OHE11390.1 MAG: guanylate kinase [Sulfurimonas sp. RIFOXYC2_FULL_36_7]OHE16076.1 MAG: guanylate kinase [Sulfurimonas sp. RIFOXYB2_FULL_37_5]OHE16481.1 MAG: guanylate kinase [Sulfurimonas sp. RIFOXYD12_FULL_36_11]MBS4068129.1 guanylate kinase [Sulfurimonas sp.]MDD3855420.1 guanylate kinase [Sulfurimonas sp.]